MIQGFINYLKINRGLSAETCKAYRKALQTFAGYMRDQHTEKTWRTITKQDIDGYVCYLAYRQHKPATIKQHVAAIRTFYRTLRAMGYMTTSPAQYVSTPKKPESAPKTINKETIRQALDGRGTPTAKAAIAILYETGMRIQELLDMRAEDIDSKQQSIKVVGKGNKSRIVYYGELTKTYGRKWRVGRYEQRELRSMIYYALEPYRHLGDTQLSPHALRHTMATEMLNNGAELEEVQRLLGHKDVKTTQIYARSSNKKIATAYKAAAPRI